MCVCLCVSVNVYVCMCVYEIVICVRVSLSLCMCLLLDSHQKKYFVSPRVFLKHGDLFYNKFALQAGGDIFQLILKRCNIVCS